MCVAVPCMTRGLPHAEPPAILPCLSAADGRFECSTPLAHHIYIGRSSISRLLLIAVCCGLWARYPCGRLPCFQQIFGLTFFFVRDFYSCCVYSSFLLFDPSCHASIDLEPLSSSSLAGGLKLVCVAWRTAIRFGQVFCVVVT